MAADGGEGNAARSSKLREPQASPWRGCCGRGLEALVLEVIRQNQGVRHSQLHRRFREVFPRPRAISASSFPTPRIVDAVRSAKNQYTILDCSRHLSSMRRLPTASREECEATLDALLADLAPHVRVDGKGVSAEDFVVIDALSQPGAYFPCIHTDTEWDTYPSDGFQVWYLLENEEEHNRGNMYVFDTEHVLDSAASSLLLEGDQFLQFRCSDEFTAINTIPSSSLADAALYLDMRPGECLVFGQRMYHMSDYRVPRPRRRAVNFRVALAPNGLRVEWGDNVVERCVKRLKARRCRKVGNMLLPGRYCLSGLR